MMRALALALLLLAPTALAGTEDEPEVYDGEDQSKTSIDLVSAWFENTWSGVRFTIKVAGFSANPASHDYFVGFRLNGDRQVAMVSFDAEGGVHSIFSPPGFGSLYSSAEKFPDSLTDIRITRGTPAYVSAVIPWGATKGFEPGAAITDIFAATDDRRKGDGRDYVDLKSTSKTFVLERRILGLSQPAAVGLGSALALAAVGGVGLGVYVRRSHNPPAPPTAAPPPPPEEPPAEPAAQPHRFSLGPRQR